LSAFKFDVPPDDASDHYGEYHAILVTAIQNYIRRPEHWQDADYETAMQQIDTLLLFLQSLAEEFP